MRQKLNQESTVLQFRMKEAVKAEMGLPWEFSKQGIISVKGREIYNAKRCFQNFFPSSKFEYLSRVTPLSSKCSPISRCHCEEHNNNIAHLLKVPIALALHSR